MQEEQPSATFIVHSSRTLCFLSLGNQGPCEKIMSGHSGTEQWWGHARWSHWSPEILQQPRWRISDLWAASVKPSLSYSKELPAVVGDPMEEPKGSHHVALGGYAPHTHSLGLGCTRRGLAAERKAHPPGKEVTLKSWWGTAGWSPCTAQCSF